MISSRARFRTRLHTDNRRWVLFLLGSAAAAELAAALLRVQADHSHLREVLTLVLVFAAFIPLTTVGYALLQTRFLWWTGRWLGGTASIRDLHAAVAWASAPIAVCAPPLSAGLIFSLLQATKDLAPIFADCLEVLVAAASLWAAVRTVIFLAEAQRFSKRRAAANIGLAGSLLIGVAAAGLFAAGVL